MKTFQKSTLSGSASCTRIYFLNAIVSVQWFSSYLMTKNYPNKQGKVNYSKIVLNKKGIIGIYYNAYMRHFT